MSFTKRFSTLFKKKKPQEPSSSNEELSTENTQQDEPSSKEAKPIPAQTNKNKKSKKIQYVYDSTRPTFIDQIPQELKMEIVKHLEMYDILSLGSVSKSWKEIMNKEELWKLQIEKTTNNGGQKTRMKTHNAEILTPKFLEDNQVETWKQAYGCVNRLKWDEQCKEFSRIEITEKGKVVEDVGDCMREFFITNSIDCRFCVARTARGFSKGKHYWEIRVLSGSCDAFNIYIGVAVKDLNSLWKLGTKSDESWAIRGCDGRIYYNDQTEECAEIFKESDVIGVYLNMDANPPALCWHVHGRYSSVFRIQNIRGPKVLYPAVSMINKGEKLALNYPVPIPPGLPTIK